MRFECSFASIARSNRLVSKITCNSTQAPGRGYFQKLVPIIAAVATAITMVAIQPTMRSAPRTIYLPIIFLLTLINIIIAITGTDTTPLITALQKSALIGSSGERVMPKPLKVAITIVALGALPPKMQGETGSTTTASAARPCRAQNMKSIWPILTIAMRVFVWNRQSHSASLDEAAFEVPYLREADEVV